MSTDVSQIALHAEQRDRERASLAFLNIIKELREQNDELSACLTQLMECADGLEATEEEECLLKRCQAALDGQQGGKP